MGVLAEIEQEIHALPSKSATVWLVSGSAGASDPA